MLLNEMSIREVLLDHDASFGCDDGLNLIHHHSESDPDAVFYKNTTFPAVFFKEIIKKNVYS